MRMSERREREPISFVTTTEKKSITINGAKVQMLQIQRKWWIVPSSHWMIPLKFKNQFKYIGNNISSTETDVNIRIGKAWSAIDK